MPRLLSMLTCKVALRRITPSLEHFVGLLDETRHFRVIPFSSALL